MGVISQAPSTIVQHDRRLMTTTILVVLGACATPPPPVDEYSVDIPANVTDQRARFREIYCAVLAQHGKDLPDYRPCSAALSPVAGEPAGTSAPVDLGNSRRRLVAAIIPGIGYACFVSWLESPGSVAAHLRKYDYDLISIEVDALSGIETNARQIRDAIMARPPESGPPRLVLVGYSKGGPDILEAVVRYPEIRDRVAAVVNAAAAVGGSVLANDAKQQQADLLRHWPRADCDPGDGCGVASLRTDVRRGLARRERAAATNALLLARRAADPGPSLASHPEDVPPARCDRLA